MDYERRLRKYNNSLITCGKGTIAFGFWGVLKTIVIMLLALPQFHRVYYDTPGWLVNLVVFLLVILIGGVIFAFHLYLGGSAISAGRNNRKKYVYIAIAILYALFLICSLPNYFTGDMIDDDTRFEETQDLIEDSADVLDMDDPDVHPSEEENGEPEEEGMKLSLESLEDFEIDTLSIYSDSIFSYVVSFLGDIMLLWIMLELIVTSVKRIRLMKDDAVEKHIQNGI